MDTVLNSDSTAIFGQSEPDGALPRAALHATASRKKYTRNTTMDSTMFSMHLMSTPTDGLNHRCLGLFQRGGCIEMSRYHFFEYKYEYKYFIFSTHRYWVPIPSTFYFCWVTTYFTLFFLSVLHLSVVMHACRSAVFQGDFCCSVGSVLLPTRFIDRSA